MAVISVTYPHGGGTTFDHGYYMQTHIPMVKRLWSPLGLQDLKVLRGVNGPDGAEPTYELVALLTFGSMEEFGAAAKQQGAAIFADIPNFTDSQPVVQFNEPA